MPLTKKGQRIRHKMEEECRSDSARLLNGTKKGKSVFYASRNKGTITGVDPESSGKSKKKRKVRGISYSKA